MRFSLLIILLLLAPRVMSAGPAGYSSAKIYVVTGDYVDPPTADFIRKEANMVISLGVDTRELFDSLHWDKAKHNPAIKKTATPLVMIMDFYHRVQPAPPAAPSFDTLYCSRKISYSDEGAYIDISSFTSEIFSFMSKALHFPFVN